MSILERDMMKGSTQLKPVPKSEPVKPDPKLKQSERKWGVAVMKHGYCIFPSILLQAQARLCINAQQMMVLLQLAEHWWTEEGKIFPSKTVLGDRIGLSPKQIQRHMRVLEQKNLAACRT